MSMRWKLRLDRSNVRRPCERRGPVPLHLACPRIENRWAPASAGATGRGKRALRVPRSQASQRGYSLLEVIIAFALLAAALALLLGTLSSSARQVRRSADAGTAALHARSLLDQVGVGAPLTAGEARGDWEDGRYAWTLRVAPWRDPSAPPANLQPQAVGGRQVFEVALDVRWGEASDQQLELRSLRLVDGVPVGP